MNLLGLTEAGASRYDLAVDKELLGGPYTLDVEVTLAKVTAYVDGQKAGGSDQPLVAVVRDSTGDLVAYSDEVIVEGGAGFDPAAWVDWPFSEPPTLEPGDYEIGLLAGAGNCVRVYGNPDAGGRVGADTYADGPSPTQTTLFTNTHTPSAYATYFYPWTPPDLPDLDLARYGFYTAQSAIGTVAADPRTRKTVQASWHGTKFDVERQDTSFAIVQVGGELTDYVGQRIKITGAMTRTGTAVPTTERSVIAYVHRETDLDLPDGEQISLTRRLFAQLAPLATNKLLVTVEALGPESMED